MPKNIDYQAWLHTAEHTFQTAPIVPDGSFGNAQIGTTNPIAANKVDHQYAPILAQVDGSAASAETRVVHVAKAAGTVEQFQAGPVVAATGDSTVTIDLHKNGSSILTATITIDNGDAAYAKVPAAIDDDEYVAGDVFEIVITVSAGTGTLPQGVWAQPIFREAA